MWDQNQNLNKVFTSPDGSTWTAHDSGVYWELNKVVGSNSRIVAVGVNATVLTSTDGNTFAVRSSDLTDVYGVKWLGSQFLAVGLNGTMMTSSDAVSWSTITSGTTVELDSVASSGSQVIVTGVNGTILTTRLSRCTRIITRNA